MTALVQWSYSFGGGCSDPATEAALAEAITEILSDARLGVTGTQRYVTVDDVVTHNGPFSLITTD